ncbi:MAG: PqqD family protein [Acidobacteriota bacterium]
MKPTLGYLPEARREGIISKEADGELLIYDLERDKAHCLNLTAAFIWKNCNGRRTISELARAVSKEMDVTIDEAVIQLAIRQLSRDNLLKGYKAMPPAADLSRRAIVRRLGVGAVLLPLITSITAPTARAVVSCPSGACTTDSECGAPTSGCICSTVFKTCVPG